MLIQRINFNLPYYKKFNISFKNNNQKQYTKEDIEKTSDTDELNDIIRRLHHKQVYLNIDIEKKEQECADTKAKWQELKKEKHNLEVKRYENEKLFNLAFVKFIDIINKDD